MCMILLVNYPLFLSDFNESSNFSTDFREVSNTKLYEFCPMEGESFHAEGRTDMTKVTFANSFANATKSCLKIELNVSCPSFYIY